MSHLLIYFSYNSKLYYFKINSSTWCLCVRACVCVFFNRETKCSVFISQEKPNQPVIFNPDFFVERLRHEHPQAFTELVLSNITRLIDLPGDEFAQLTGESEPRVPTSSGFLRSFNFLRRKGWTIWSCVI